jgi:hypothetical protein
MTNCRLIEPFDGAVVRRGPRAECLGPFDLRAQTVVPSAQGTDMPKTRRGE